MKKNTKSKTLRKLLAALAAAGCIGVAACAKDKEKLQVSLNVGDDVQISERQAEVEKGGTYELPTPTRAGYEFAGWYETEDFSGEAITKIENIEANRTLYAKWEKLYNVSLNPNGGTLAVTSVTAKSGTNVYELLKDYEPKKEGFVFGAWFDANGRELSKTATIGTADVSFTAKYKVGYTVEIFKEKLDGEGYEKEENTYYDYPQTVVTADDGARGFSEETKADSKTSITLGENATENVLRVYFKRKTFSVSYKAEYPDGSGKAETESAILYGKGERVPCNYTAEGYYLVGWALKKDGEPIYRTDAMKHSMYGEENEEESSDEVFPDSNMNLYAVWSKGYIDMFGGKDYIYLIDGEAVEGEQAKKEVYLCRGDKFFKGVYNESKAEFTFKGENENLYGKIINDKTFAYRDGAREGIAFLYRFSSGEKDENVSLIFDKSNGVQYTVTDPVSGKTSSKGSYALDEDGYYKATFTEGEMAGKEVTFFLGSLNNEEKTRVFVQRNDDEIKTYDRFAVMITSSESTDFSLVYAGLTGNGGEISLDGFGIATLNVGTLEEPEKSQYFYSVESTETGEEKIVLYDTSYHREVGVLRIVEYTGNKGYMFYNQAFDTTIVAEDGSSITMDGLCNLTYKDKNGEVIEEGLFAQQSAVMGQMVWMNTHNKQYRFLITSTTEEFTNEAGETEKKTTYSFVEKSANYQEYYYQDENGTMRGPLLVIDDEKAGEASLYEYVASTKTYVKAAVGSYETDNQKKSYVFVKQQNFAVEGGTEFFDFANLNSAVFTTMKLTSESNSYNVYYVESMVVGGTVENNVISYHSAVESLTLKKIGSILILNDGGKATIGTFETNSSGITRIVSGAETVYLRIDEEKLTFEKLWTVPYSAKFYKSSGEVDETKSLMFDGTGSATKGGAQYSVKNGEVTTVYTGEFEETNETNPIAEGAKLLVFTGKDEHENKITLKFMRVRGSSSVMLFAKDDALDVDYICDEGRLTLDGYGYAAKYTKDGKTVRGTFVADKDVDGLIYLYTTDEEIYLFDLIREEERFTVRGNEYGTRYIAENQFATGLLVDFDGYGHLVAYRLDESVEGGKVYVDKNATYTIDGDSVLMTITENEQTDIYKGEMRILVFGNMRVPCIMLYQKETVAVTYVNRDDLSLMKLDRLGNAVKYTKLGAKETGYYTLISENLLYYYSSAAESDCVYYYDKVTKDVEKCEYPEEFSYYTSELSAMLFEKTGIVRMNGERDYYQITENGVDIYKRSEENGNEFGFEKLEGFLTIDENNDYVAQKQFEGKTYHINKGFDLSFERDNSDKNEGKLKYPLTFIDVGDEDGKVPIRALKFAPTGADEFSVKGTVYISYHKLVKEKKLDENGNPVLDENGKVVYENKPGELVEDNPISCTISRVKETEGGNSVYRLYLTVLSYRMRIEVNYTGDVGVSTYSVKSLDYIKSFDSFNYAFYSAMYGMMGMDSPIKNPGKISLTARYDEEGNELYRHITSEFTEEGGFVDSEGNVLEFDCEYHTVGKEYRCDFVGKDGKNYRLYMQTMDEYAQYYGVNGYSMIITRVEKIESGDYTVEVERIVATDTQYELGDYAGLKLYKKDGEELKEIAVDKLYRLSTDKPWTYIVREYNEEKKIVSTKYYEIMLTEETMMSEKNNLPFFVSASVAEKAIDTYYTQDGKAFVDVHESEGVKYLSVNGKIYVATKCEYNEETGTYTIYTSSGKRFTVKIVEGVAEIAEVKGNA